jgi:hypothetical protein
VLAILAINPYTKKSQIFGANFRDDRFVHLVTIHSQSLSRPTFGAEEELEWASSMNCFSIHAWWFSIFFPSESEFWWSTSAPAWWKSCVAHSNDVAIPDCNQFLALSLESHWVLIAGLARLNVSLGKFRVWLALFNHYSDLASDNNLTCCLGMLDLRVFSRCLWKFIGHITTILVHLASFVSTWASKPQFIYVEIHCVHLV